jgi:hypothetical protein
VGKGDKPKDARETLNQLEKRLRDLERELRAGVPDQAPAVPAPAVPAPAIPEVPLAAPRAEPSAVRVPAEIEVLVDEARIRAGALHDSLDGLVDVNDHLRDTAQTLVEDYGRLLVRVSRLAAPSTPAEKQQPDAPAPEAVPEPPDRPPIFVPNLPPEAAAPLVRPPWETPDPPRRRRHARWLIPLLILLVAAAATAAVLRSRQSDSSRTTPAAGTRQLLVVSDAAGLPLGPARRSSGPAAVAAVCAGRAAGAVVAAPDARPCPGAVVVTSVTTSATGVVSPRRADGSGRRCLSLTGTGRPGAHRTSRPATRARASAIERGGRTASEAARADELPPATVIRATRAGARQAAVSYDADHQLRALAIAARVGGACVRPTAANLLSGRYPLARRLVLLVADRAAASSAVTVARRTLDRAFGGAPALDADVTG